MRDGGKSTGLVASEAGPMGCLGRADMLRSRRAFLSCPERSNAAPATLSQAERAVDRLWKGEVNMSWREFITRLGGSKPHFGTKNLLLYIASFSSVFAVIA